MLNKLKVQFIGWLQKYSVKSNEQIDSQKIVVKIQGGHIVATESLDPKYLGIDVEFISDSDNGGYASRPRVLFEKPVEYGELRVLVWDDKNSEDYTEEIIFEE